MSELEKAIYIILDSNPEKDLGILLKNLLYSIENSKTEPIFPEFQEILKPIPDMPGYLASSFGKIFSEKTNRYLKPFLSNQGYEMISISLNGKTKKYSVHRLVATTFKFENKRDNFVVNHKDFNKTNNHINNLNWLSPSGNNKHTYINKGKVINDFIK